MSRPVTEHLADALHDLMVADPRRVLLGEDVRDGGMLGLSRRVCDDEALRTRICATPLTSVAGLAHAGGLALGGHRPIVLLPSAAALVEGLAAVREIAALSWRSAGTRPAPVLFVAPSGPGFGLGGDSAWSPETWLAGIDDLRVVCPGTASSFDAWLRGAATEEDGPTVLLLARELLLTEVDDDDLEHDTAGATVRHEGEAATVFAWGATVDRALAAATAIDAPVTVVDVASLRPFAEDALVEAARATGKIVIAHAGPRTLGFGAELAALFADEAILSLDAPIVRVTGSDGWLTAADEDAGSPSIQEIAEAIQHVVHY